MTIDKPTIEQSRMIPAKNIPPIEVVLVVIILSIFVAVTISISLALTPVWLDEVTVADPAVNLYMGKGFTSTGWQYQTKEEFWASNAPLHQILLYHWMLVFGFNPVSVRSISVVLMTVAIVLIWLAVYRLDLVKTTQTRLVLVALLICGAGVTFNYALGRYDCIGISICTAAFFAYSIQATWMRCVVLTFIGALLPIAGVNLIPYELVIGGILIFYLGKQYLKEFISLNFGVFLGLIFLYMLYVTNGVAKTLLISAGGHGLAGSFDKSSVNNIGETDLIEKIIFVLINIPKILLNRLSHLPGWFLVDPSFFCLFLVLLGVAIYWHLNHHFTSRSILSCGIAIGVAIPIVLGILRNYPFYYSWMAYIPVAICVSSILPEFWLRDRNLIGRFLLIGLIAAACWPGYPARLLAVAQGSQLQRDYPKLEKFVIDNIKKDDRVYSDFEAYYPVKRQAYYVLLPTYKDVMSDQEKRELSVLLVKPENYQDVVQFIGGQWSKVSELNVRKPYMLNLYRRSS